MSTHLSLTAERPWHSSRAVLDSSIIDRLPAEKPGLAGVATCDLRGNADIAYAVDPYHLRRGDRLLLRGGDGVYRLTEILAISSQRRGVQLATANGAFLVDPDRPVPGAYSSPTNHFPAL